MREKRKEKRFWIHSKTLIITSLVLLERSQWDKSNDTNWGYQRWIERAIWAI